MRRILPSVWFNEKTTVAGRKALNWYHEKWDEKRNIGLGAEHDWSSHGADAFGLMCLPMRTADQQLCSQANIALLIPFLVIPVQCFATRYCGFLIEPN
ncbi:Uncharacterised protein [Candidatus Bartonella washoeensis]|nr:Uncharacterised protein [Bartonella washoeensis]